MCSWFDDLPRVNSSDGFPAVLQTAFADTASTLNATILIRAPGEATARLLEERYDAKGFFIKGKSCDWGPMSGFICMAPLLNKKGSAGWSFNRKMHRHYLETLLWMNVQGEAKKGVLAGNLEGYPGFPEGQNADDSALRAVIARAGQPLWISDKQRVALEVGNVMAPSAAYYQESGGGGRVGIAVDSPTVPSVALEFVLRPIVTTDQWGGHPAPGEKLWAVYACDIYRRELGEIENIEYDDNEQPNVITLARGQGAAFAQSAHDSSRVLLTGNDTDGGSATTVLSVIVEGDKLRVADVIAPSRLRFGRRVQPRVQSRWRTAERDLLLDSSDRVQHVGIEFVDDPFVGSYGSPASAVPASLDESNMLRQMRRAFWAEFFPSELSGRPYHDTVNAFSPVIALKNPFPPSWRKPSDGSRHLPDLRGSYLDAVTGDFDLAAVWPAFTPDTEIVRNSELQWKRRRPGPSKAREWWLRGGESLFIPMGSKPFAVQSKRLPGLIVEFIPSEKRLKGYELGSGELGNTNNIVLAAVQWANSFAAAIYGRGERSDGPTVSTGDRVSNPPNVAFHGDEGGRPDIEDIDWPFAGFLPRLLSGALGNRADNFALRKPVTGTVQHDPRDDFLTIIAKLAPMSRVLIHSVWLWDLLREDTRANRVIWLLIRGVPEEPPADQRQGRDLPDDFLERLRTELRDLVAPVADDNPDVHQPSLQDLDAPVQDALTVEVPRKPASGQATG